jgi:hypothetical protein
MSWSKAALCCLALVEGYHQWSWVPGKALVVCLVFKLLATAELFALHL